ncbi:putative ankyrin repeat protein [Chloropicon roscoffensis]|uniref:Ankyrin repeat protein n=1 Tax=Chloropicon roscoffensis TaxID=1461544 RepID=A0AAX4PF84_9CHLO
MVSTKKRRRRAESTDTEPAFKALRQENEELREENEGLKLKIAKFEAGCKTPQEKDKEVKLPTEMWVIVAGKLDKNDVCSFALVSKQLREAQVLAGRELVTRPCSKPPKRTKRIVDFNVSYFTEDWCAYWSRKFNVHHTDPEVVKRVLYVAANKGYLQVFEKYWSQGPQEKLSKLWDKYTCGFAAFHGHLEVLKWLRAKGCPWGQGTCIDAALGGQLEVLQWMRGQDPPCPWLESVCYDAARGGHLEVLRWLRSQGCSWSGREPSAAAKNGHLEMLQWMRAQDPPCPGDEDVCYLAAHHGHLEVLRWARSQGCPWNKSLTWTAAMSGQLKVLVWLIKEGCPYDKRQCREAAAEGGESTRKVLEWLDM